MNLRDYTGGLQVTACPDSEIIIQGRGIFVSDCDYVALARALASLDDDFIDCLFARVKELQNIAEGEGDE